MGRLPRRSEVQRRRDIERAGGEAKKQGHRRLVWSLPDTHPQVIRRKARRAAANEKRFGKGGRWDRLGDAIGKVPIVGQTVLAPMSGFLKGSSKLYEAVKDPDDLDIDTIKEVGKKVVDVAKDMKKQG
jgi:hypothetical protein